MRILVIGTGYVGLVTGASFAEMGHNVTCLDIDKDKIAALNLGIVPFYEPGLEELVKRNSKAERLLFTNSYEACTENAQVIFLALPSPSNPDGSCNTAFLENAVMEISRCLKGHVTVINKSTAPAGTCFRLQILLEQALKAQKNPATFDMVSNPEFLKEGSAVQDFMKPDRIIIGGETQKAIETVKEIYAPFNLNHERVVEMDILSAEMTKYAANAMLATRISFMNEISAICKKVGANINLVRKGIGSDSRIGYSFLYAGIGYGGSCFPKDVRALCDIAKKNGVEPHLLKAVEEVNQHQKKLLVQNIDQYFSLRGGINGKTIAVWGLSFKPDTDDVREAPSLTIIPELLKRGAILKLYDPVAAENAKKSLAPHQNLHFCQSEEETVKDADAIALLTEWKQFRIVDFKQILKKMRSKVIFDGRNQYKPGEVNKLGYHYIGIGQPDVIN